MVPSEDRLRAEARSILRTVAGEAEACEASLCAHTPNVPGDRRVLE